MRQLCKNTVDGTVTEYGRWDSYNRIQLMRQLCKNTVDVTVTEYSSQLQNTADGTVKIEHNR